MHDTGFRVQFACPDCVMRSGLVPYWSIDFTNLMMGVNKSGSVNESIFPNALPETNQVGVSYIVTDDAGNEILKHSISLREKAIPDGGLKKLQAAIEQLHKWADDPRVPQEKREFCRKFRLPDPKNDPDAYRMTGGMFSRKLHVLWGYEKVGSTAFLPSSAVSAKWDDAGKRKSIYQECRGSVWRRIFRLRNVVLTLVSVAAVYFGFFYPVRCHIHHCQVGKGIWNLMRIETECTKRCELPGCNLHLDEKLKCNAHLCRKCKKPMPMTNGQNGLCDPCFWGTLR